MYDHTSTLRCIPVFGHLAVSIDCRVRSLAQDETVLKTVEPNGVAMLSRYPFERLELHEMHSLMQRNALLAEINVNGHKARRRRRATPFRIPT